MAEYIEREALRKSLLIGAAYLDEDTMMTVVNVLDCFPAADVAPVRHGRWLERVHDDGFGEYPLFHCSECDVPSARKRNYCSYCGAKMDGETDG